MIFIESSTFTRSFAEVELTLKTFAVPSLPPTYTPERISRIRKSLHMSQGVFAHVLNVSTKTVQSWEQGLREPTQAAQRLLEVLEKSLKSSRPSER